MYSELKYLLNASVNALMLKLGRTVADAVALSCLPLLIPDDGSVPTPMDILMLEARHVSSAISNYKIHYLGSHNESCKKLGLVGMAEIA